MQNKRKMKKLSSLEIKINHKSKFKEYEEAKNLKNKARKARQKQ